MESTGTGSSVAEPELALRKRYSFADNPGAEDFRQVAEYLEQSSQELLHPALRPNCNEIIAGLRRMAGAPHEAAHQSAYHALRLFI